MSAIDNHYSPENALFDYSRTSRLVDDRGQINRSVDGIMLGTRMKTGALPFLNSKKAARLLGGLKVDSLLIRTSSPYSVNRPPSVRSPVYLTRLIRI